MSNQKVNEENTSENNTEHGEIESFRVSIDDDSRDITYSDNSSNDSQDNSRPEDILSQHNKENNEYRQIKQIQNLALAGSICGAISVIIGGVLLSGVGLALGISCLIKFKKLNGSSFDSSLRKKLRVSAVISIIISAGALVLNFISALVMLPTILSYLQNGDATSIDSLFDSISTETPKRSSTWG